MGKCDDGYTAMTLQFATKDDIKVTNAGDKHIMLPKLTELNGRVKKIEIYLDNHSISNSQVI